MHTEIRDAVIRVHTFKEGLLSRLAHDLLLNLGRFEIEAQGDKVHAVGESQSLEVLGVARDGELIPESLGTGEKEAILQNLAEQVLRSEQFPRVRFTATVTRGARALSMKGSLELCGTSQPLQVDMTRSGDRLIGTFELVPSRFGIKPFRALAGALKVQDRVRITVDARAPADGTPAAECVRWIPAAAQAEAR
jgi:hypothetical protein